MHQQQQQQQKQPQSSSGGGDGGGEKAMRGRHATPAQERREEMHWLKKKCDKQTEDISALHKQVAAYASQLGSKDGQIFELNARIHQLEA